MRRALFLSLMACLALLVAAGLAGSLAQSTPAASKAITPSPIYTAAQLGAPAGDDWLMHMGNLKGHRYSSLTQISKANVGTLKLAWKINLGYCTTKNAACGSLEANAVVANGVQYIQDPFGAVYALDGATGARLWKWTPTYEAGFGVGSGSRKPGVAIGEGKVFAGLARRPALRPQPDRRNRPLVDGSDAVENGRQDLERPDLRQRHGPRRRLRGRQRRLQRHHAGVHGRTTASASGRGA